MLPASPNLSNPGYPERAPVSIAIAFVARTGIVMGTDSRVTATRREGKTREDAYPKLVPFGELPVALSMVGAGFYGGRDFRALVAETHRAWCDAGREDLSVEGIARIFASTAGEVARKSRAKTGMHVLVGGFSPRQVFGELWEVDLPAGTVTQRARPGAQTFVWRGQTDAVKTLWWGFHTEAMTKAMRDNEIEDETIDAVLKSAKKSAAWGPERINWGMPLSSAVDLVRFQLHVQIQYSRFMPGRGSCGEPSQIVAINDTGLKWMDNPFAPFNSVGC